MEPIISVIVPVYKTEAYIWQCVDSILGQTFSDLELILVDDGSPDDCGRICDGYAQKDPRVRVIHKKNGGLSDARNAGMRVAAGAYWMFVDSDDLLPPKAAETLLDIAVSQGAALVIGAHERFEDVLVPAQADKEPHCQIMTAQEAMADMFQNGCAAWGRLYRREIHEGIPFPVGEINEDEAIALRLIERCEHVVKTDAVVYHYRCRPESITTSRFSAKQLDWQRHCAANLRFVQEEYPELELDAAERYRNSLLWSLTEIALSDGDFTGEIRYLRQELRQNAGLFRRIPFRCRQNRIRMAVLLHLPFGFYKKMLRLKRGVPDDTGESMSNSQPLVSVIVPVYKVEKYLDECVASVRGQTYQNLEIILVDDGSPDRCGQMCDDYAARDPRVKVIHQENAGVAKARNAGLARAKGGYLFFADSDDVLAADALNLLVDSALRYDADMVCGSCNKIDEESKSLGTEETSEFRIMMTQEALRYYAPKEWAPWNRLMKAQIHEGIVFPPYKIHEDEAIKFRLLEKCSRVIQSGVVTYSYRQRSSSITAQDSGTDRMDMFYSRRENLEYLKQHHPDIITYFLPNVCTAALYNLSALIRQGITTRENPRLEQIVAFAAQEKDEIKKNMRLSRAEKLRFWMIVHSDWHKKKCLYIRFYAVLEKVRGR